MYSLNTTQQIERGGGRIVCQKVEKRKDDLLFHSLNSYPNEISQQRLFISVEIILQLCSSLNVFLFNVSETEGVSGGQEPHHQTTG